MVVGNDDGSVAHCPRAQRCPPHIRGAPTEHRGPPFRLDAPPAPYLIRLPFRATCRCRASFYLAFARRHSWLLDLFKTVVLTKLDAEDQNARTSDHLDPSRCSGKLDCTLSGRRPPRRQAWQITEALLAAISDESGARRRSGADGNPGTYQTYHRERRRVPAAVSAGSTTCQIATSMRSAIGSACVRDHIVDVSGRRRGRSGAPLPPSPIERRVGNCLAADEVQGFLTSTPGPLPSPCD